MPSECVMFYFHSFSPSELNNEMEMKQMSNNNSKMARQHNNHSWQTYVYIKVKQSEILVSDIGLVFVNDMTSSILMSQVNTCKLLRKPERYHISSLKK